MYKINLIEIINFNNWLLAHLNFFINKFKCFIKILVDNLSIYMANSCCAIKSKFGTKAMEM